MTPTAYAVMVIYVMGLVGSTMLFVREADKHIERLVAEYRREIRPATVRTAMELVITLFAVLWPLTWCWALWRAATKPSGR